MEPCKILREASPVPAATGAFRSRRGFPSGFSASSVASRERGRGTLTMRTNNNIRRTMAAAAAMLLVTTLAATARAGSTDPVLVIGQATASGGSPARVIDLLGAWGFDDVLQIDFPLNIVVSQGTSFVRYPVGDIPVAGTFAGLSNGLAESEIAALEAAGTPTADALILRLSLHEMSLALPAAFASGSVNVVLYTTVPGHGTFLSNTAEAAGSGL